MRTAPDLVGSFGNALLFLQRPIVSRCFKILWCVLALWWTLCLSDLFYNTGSSVAPWSHVSQWGESPQVSSCWQRLQTKYLLCFMAVEQGVHLNLGVCLCCKQCWKPSMYHDVSWYDIYCYGLIWHALDGEWRCLKACVPGLSPFLALHSFSSPVVGSGTLKPQSFTFSRKRLERLVNSLLSPWTSIGIRQQA